MKKIFFYQAGMALTCLLLVLSCSKSSDNNQGPVGPATTVINIVGTPMMAFTPGTTTVKVGTIIKWTNSDAVPHAPVSDNGTTFNPGSIAAGSYATYTTTVTGSFPYHCSIHTGMTGTLVVTP